jgi:hypothetical protein
MLIIKVWRISRKEVCVFTNYHTVTQTKESDSMPSQKQPIAVRVVNADVALKNASSISYLCEQNSHVGRILSMIFRERERERE